jgi:hypothetical protein
MSGVAPMLAELRFPDGQLIRGTLSHIARYANGWRAVLQGHLPPGRTSWLADGTSIEVNGISFEVEDIDVGVPFEPTAFILVLAGNGASPTATG